MINYIVALIIKPCEECVQSQIGKIKQIASLYPLIYDTAYSGPCHQDWFIYLIWTLIHSTREYQDIGNTEVNKDTRQMCKQAHRHTEPTSTTPRPVHAHETNPTLLH